MSLEAADDAVREVLRDAFSRVREQVDQIYSGVSQEQATYRPDPEANSIAWLIWHLTRIQDDHVCGLSGEEQLWTRDGWYDRFGLPFAPDVHGYGHSSADVAVVQADYVRGLAERAGLPGNPTGSWE